ncbi:MAG: hypothetical protein ACK8QZ_09625 [Anaerolineales bacterium]
MKKKAGNVAPLFRHLSKQDLERLASTHLLENHLRFKPNYFLTVRLYGADDRRTAKWLNENERPAQLLAGVRIVNQLDKAVYGSLVRRLLAGSRYPYFMRLETVSKTGDACPGHYHILFKLSPIEEAHFHNRQEALRAALMKKLRALGFAPDIMLQEHDAQKCSYLTKYAHEDVLNFFTRDFPAKA